MMRDMILSSLDGKMIKVGGNIVRVLHEIPWKTRQRRLIYKQFAAILRRHVVKYSWIIPEGMFFTYKGMKFKITSLLKAQDFLDKYRQELGEGNFTLTEIGLLTKKPAQEVEENRGERQRQRGKEILPELIDLDEEIEEETQEYKDQAEDKQEEEEQEEDQAYEQERIEEEEIQRIESEDESRGTEEELRGAEAPRIARLRTRKETKGKYIYT